MLKKQKKQTYAKVAVPFKSLLTSWHKTQQAAGDERWEPDAVNTIHSTSVKPTRTAGTVLSERYASYKGQCWWRLRYTGNTTQQQICTCLSRSTKQPGRGLQRAWVINSRETDSKAALEKLVCFFLFKARNVLWSGHCCFYCFAESVCSSKCFQCNILQQKAITFKHYLFF